MKKRYTNTETFGSGDIVGADVFNVLASKGIAVSVENLGICYRLKTDVGVNFIIIEPSAQTPEEAIAQSEFIAKSFLHRCGGSALPPNPSAQDDNSKTMVIVGDLWRRKREMMTGRVLAHCGIYTQIFARNCEVRKITKSAANAFMEESHSYGAATCRHCYGIYTQKPTHECGKEILADTLVAVAEFSNARTWQKDGQILRSYEWIRFASRPDVRVSGGMGKILSKFISDINPDDIMSYADLEWSDGDVYRILGFTLESHKSPVLFAIDRDSWQRHPLVCRKPSDISPEPASSLVYYQNFGSLKYRLTLPK